MARTPLTQQEILKLLQSKHVLTASQIVENLAAQNMKVNKTTVYRAIEKLLDQGKICKLLIKGDIPSYELRSHNHDHFICERCGAVISIPTMQFVPSPSLKNKKIGHHHLTIFGLCESCALKQ